MKQLGHQPPLPEDAQRDSPLGSPLLETPLRRASRLSVRDAVNEGWGVPEFLDPAELPFDLAGPLALKRDRVDRSVAAGEVGDRIARLVIDATERSNGRIDVVQEHLHELLEIRATRHLLDRVLGCLPRAGGLSRGCVSVSPNLGDLAVRIEYRIHLLSAQMQVRRDRRRALPRHGGTSDEQIASRRVAAGCARKRELRRRCRLGVVLASPRRPRTHRIPTPCAADTTVATATTAPPMRGAQYLNRARRRRFNRASTSSTIRSRSFFVTTPDLSWDTCQLHLTLSARTDRAVHERVSTFSQRVVFGYLRESERAGNRLGRACGAPLSPADRKAHAARHAIARRVRRSRERLR